MEIYQLRTFATVARLGSITRASEALHVSQPAVTAQLKALEEELGMPLFDRKPGRVAITEAGGQLLSDAEDMLAAAGSMMAKARRLVGEVTGSVAIGSTPEVDPAKFGALLEQLGREWPLVKLHTRRGYGNELRQLVGTGVLQGAFYIGSAIPGDVLGIPLQTIHYRIAGPVAARAKLLRAGWCELAGMPWIVAPCRHHLHALLADVFARQGLAPRNAVEMDEASCPVPYIAAGVGLALVREDQALAAAEQQAVVIWPHARVAAVQSFIYPRAAAEDPLTMAMLARIKAWWGVA